MRIISLVCIALLLTTAKAEVFKCIEKFGETVYQSSPCEPNAKEHRLDINTDPAQEAAAASKLEAIQSEYESRKLAQEQRDKELEQKRMEAANQEIARRNAIAQQEQAEAQKRQAEALERRNNYDNRPLYISPYYTKPVWPGTVQPQPKPHRSRSNID